MSMRRAITKIGLAAVVAGHLLVVRKHGKPSFILPGGKPEAGEGELDALAREIEEELGCAIQVRRFEGRFAEVAADLPDTDVVVVLYTGDILGNPVPRSEIAELAWLDLSSPSKLALAPSITNKILPYLQDVFLRGAAITAQRDHPAAS